MTDPCPCPHALDCICPLTERVFLCWPALGKNWSSLSLIAGNFSSISITSTLQPVMQAGRPPVNYVTRVILASACIDGLHHTRARLAGELEKVKMLNCRGANRQFGAYLVWFWCGLILKMRQKQAHKLLIGNLLFCPCLFGGDIEIVCMQGKPGFPCVCELKHKLVAGRPGRARQTLN